MQQSYPSSSNRSSPSSTVMVDNVGGRADTPLSQHHHYNQNIVGSESQTIRSSSDKGPPYYYDASTAVSGGYPVVYPTSTAPSAPATLVGRNSCTNCTHESTSNHPTQQQGLVRQAISQLHASTVEAVNYVFFPADHHHQLDPIEQAIIEESLRVAELEESTVREEQQLERQERRDAWSVIEGLPHDGGVMLMAIQAEMERNSNQFKQASERRAQRQAQRQAAREEVARYRRQRHTSAVLRLMSYTATAMFAIYSVQSLMGGVKTTTKKVLNKQGSGDASSASSSRGASGASNNASSSSCRKRWWD